MYQCHHIIGNCVSQTRKVVITGWWPMDHTRINQCRDQWLGLRKVVNFSEASLIKLRMSDYSCVVHLTVQAVAVSQWLCSFLHAVENAITPVLGKTTYMYTDNIARVAFITGPITTHRGLMSDKGKIQLCPTTTSTQHKHKQMDQPITHQFSVHQ